MTVIDPALYADRLQEASRLRNQGQVPEAIKAYQQVLAIEPNLPDSWYNLGWLLRRDRQPVAALAAYDEALARHVGGAEEVLLNKAVIYADDLLDPAKAIEACEAALTLSPTYTPAMFNLANTYEDLGRRDEAIALYRRIHELAPLEAEPLARLGNISTANSVEDDIVVRIKAARSRGDLSAASRASLEFALGRLLDQLGLYDSAFEAYKTANLLSVNARPAGVPPFDAARHDAQVQTLIDLPAPGAAVFPPMPLSPVFILGQFRSGSSLLEQILSAHSQVSTTGELPLLPQIAASRFAPYPQALASATYAQLAEARNDYAAGLLQRRPGLTGVVTDKRPDNFYHVGLILRLFPEAKILHTVRDARDVCLSTYFLQLAPQQAHATDLRAIARQYRAYERLMAHWKSIAPDRIMDVNYDELVASPEPVIRKALDFVGLDFEPACLDFQDSTAPVKTASVWQVREPLYQRSSGRWKNYEKHLGGLLEELNG